MRSAFPHASGDSRECRANLRAGSQQDPAQLASSCSSRMPVHYQSGGTESRLERIGPRSPGWPRLRPEPEGSTLFPPHSCAVAAVPRGTPNESQTSALPYWATEANEGKPTWPSLALASRASSGVLASLRLYLTRRELGTLAVASEPRSYCET